MTSGRTIYRAWRLCRAAGIDLFAIDACDPLLSLPGWNALNLPESTSELASLLEAMRAIELRHRDAESERTAVHLVATLPVALQVTATTRDVASALIRSAKQELLVVGYAMGQADFLRLLCAKGMEGVRVTAVSDRGEDDARALWEMWPARAPMLAAYRGTEAVQGKTLMHAKTIVADRQRALIGSANFTAGGFHRNIELGVEVGGSVPAEVVRLVERLIERRWLEPVSLSRRLVR